MVMADLLVDGARQGWTDDQLKALLLRLVPQFRVKDLEIEVDLEIAGA
jgi:hypothetical protein